MIIRLFSTKRLPLFVLATCCAFVCSPADAQEVENFPKAKNWGIEASYLSSTGNKRARNLDVATFGLRMQLKEKRALSIGVKAGLLQAEGTASEDGGQTRYGADALGFYLGIPVRLQVNKSGKFRPYAELAISGIVTDRNWPEPDDLSVTKARFYAKFDASLGAEYILSADWSLSTDIQISHISNGRGVGSDNLNFDGVGASVLFTRRF